MYKKSLILPVLASAVFLSACDDGDDGNDGDDGLNSLVNTRELPMGDADCPGGGLVFESGLDANRNGVLDPEEVDNTTFLDCATAPQLRALHASPDAPPVNILVNGAPALTNVDYTQGSGFLALEEDEYRIQVEAIVPGDDPIVIDETYQLEYRNDYNVVAIGNVADPIEAFLIVNPTTEVFEGNIRAQVLHAAPDAPPVDVYVTAPDADLAASMPINEDPLAYRDYTDQLEVPAGSYQVRVTLAGDPETVVYDSGAADLEAGTDLLIAAVENTGPGATPIQLVALDGAESAVIFDAATPAAVVAVHASPDAPAVDILADDLSTAEDDAITLASNVAFTQFCEIGAVPAPGDYTISVTVAGDPASVALQFPLSVLQGDELSAIVTGFAASTPEIQALPLVNNTRSIVTESKLRITHGSPSTGPVDIYLLPDGTDLNDPDVTPDFGAVPFTADTGILSIAPDTYDVYVTPAGDKSVVAIEVQDLGLVGGEVLDVIARDPQTDGSEGALPQLVVIDQTAVAACTI